MRSFPPIREEYRGFDVWAQQFNDRESAESYIRMRNEGKRAGRVDETQSRLLDYNFGKFRYATSHHTTKSGRSYVQLHKRATDTTQKSGKTYKRGYFMPMDTDEKDPEFQRLTIDMIEKDRARERKRTEAAKR